MDLHERKRSAGTQTGISDLVKNASKQGAPASQHEAGMQKSLIVLTGGVEVLNQTNQHWPVEFVKPTFKVDPRRFLLTGLFHRVLLLPLTARKAESSPKCR